MAIGPVFWLTIANERHPKSDSVTDWIPGNVAPVRSGYYERHFTDGSEFHHFDGEVWRSSDPAEKRGRMPHWRQVGDYPCWRGLRFNAEVKGDNK